MSFAKTLFTLLFVGAIVLSLSNAQEHSVKDFEGGPFTVSPKPNLYHLNGLGLDGRDAGTQLLAVGDFNSDKYTDLIVSNDANKVLTVLLWDHDNGKFVSRQEIDFDAEIKGVIPADSNYDGNLDLVVTVANGDGVAMQIFHHTGDSKKPFNDKPTITQEYATWQQPTVADLNGDRRLDFLFNDKDGKRTVVQFKNKDNITTTPFSEYVSNKSECIKYSEVSDRRISQPNFNAFIDLTNDCIADLFLMTEDDNNRYFEIWINSQDGKFCLVENQKVTIPIASLGFSDVDRDSVIDMVFIEQDKDTSPNVHIIYNHFPGNNPENPCSGNLTFKAPFARDESEDVYNSQKLSDYKTVYKLSDVGAFGDNPRLFSTDTKHRPHQLRFGDINMDSYQDVLVTIEDSTTDDDKKLGYTYVLYNLPCDICGNDTHRMFTAAQQPSGFSVDVNKIITESHSQYGLFFDYDEIGTQSLMLISTVKESYTSVIGYYNNMNEDSFFIKVLGLNGAPGENKMLGGIYYGPAFECKITDTDANKILLKGSQLSRGHFNSLQLPYASLGLGRTNNYIENFVFGVPQKDTRLWTPIIPNSQLIVNPKGSPDNWELDVFVKPTNKTVIVIVTTVVILVILGMLLCYLHYKEKEEDKQNQERYLTFLG